REGVLLAAGKVHQDGDVYRQRRLALEGEYLLRPPVFADRDLWLLNVADDAIVSINRAERQVDEFRAQPHSLVARRHVVVFTPLRLRGVGAGLLAARALNTHA